MAIAMPSRHTVDKRTSARLDVLNLILVEDSVNDSNMKPVPARTDSMSPLREHRQDGEVRKSRSAVELPRTNEWSKASSGAPRCSCLHDAHGKRQLNRKSQAGTLKHQPDLRVAFREPATRKKAPATEGVNTCLPRARRYRPRDLIVDSSNGLTTAPVSELKQRICDGRTEDCVTTTQIPRYRPKRRLPKTPIYEVRKAMGNTHSNASSLRPDNVSIRNHSTRNPVRVLRKSSNNLLHRVESKSPLAPALSGTTIDVRQQLPPSTVEDAKLEDGDDGVAPNMNGCGSICPDEIPLPDSAATITENGIKQPLSASTTIRESRAESRRESRMEERFDGSTDLPQLPPGRPISQALSLPRGVSPAPSQAKRDSALSPTIPAPSPLPEDSPHKYGLKDRMETPEVTKAEDINAAKDRRRSSGPEIFNEAKSLQSASSFLNGLSNSRRRAESLQHSTEGSAWTIASYDTQRPASARLSRPASRPSSTLPATTYTADRRRGHNFKPSGFAYSRPLTHVQVKCFKQHARLLPSRNKVAPVECAVCHIDDDRDHYSCSWCAIRMCRYCRKDFAERGITALRERIKSAEFGASGESASSSAESLGLSRGRSSLF